MIVSLSSFWQRYLSLIIWYLTCIWLFDLYFFISDLIWWIVGLFESGIFSVCESSQQEAETRWRGGHETRAWTPRRSSKGGGMRGPKSLATCDKRGHLTSCPTYRSPRLRGRGIVKGGGVVVQEGGGRFFCFYSCVFGVGFHVIFGRSLALRGGNPKN